MKVRLQGVRRRARACSGSAIAAAGERGSHAEQPARRADRRRTTGARRSSISKASRGPSRSSSARRPTRTTTCRSCCCSAPPRPPSTRRTSSCGWASTTREELQDGFPTTREELFEYRGDHPRQRRGVGVHARAAADARGLRRRPRRRPARARRRRGRSPKAAGPARRSADALPVVLDRGIARAAVSAARAHRAPDARRRESHPATQITDTADDARGQVARPAAADVGQSAARGQAGRQRAADRRRRARPRAGRAGRISGTAAARRSRCRCRTPGSGACTRRWT